MNPLNANFGELYRRHLCRHSEFGINVLHIIGVCGVYFSLFGLVMAIPLPAVKWTVLGIALAAYFLTIARNIPVSLLVVNAAVMALIFAAVWYFPLPQHLWWIHLILLVVWHRFQIWNHSLYTRSLDMSEFAEKYQKGLKLFFLLSIYELPILLNYLVFDRKSWV